MRHSPATYRIGRGWPRVSGKPSHLASVAPLPRSFAFVEESITVRGKLAGSREMQQTNSPPIVGFSRQGLVVRRIWYFAISLQFKIQFPRGLATSYFPKVP